MQARSGAAPEHCQTASAPVCHHVQHGAEGGALVELAREAAVLHATRCHSTPAPQPNTALGHRRVAASARSSARNAHQLVTDEGGEVQRKRALGRRERVHECAGDGRDARVACIVRRRGGRVASGTQRYRWKRQYRAARSPLRRLRRSADCAARCCACATQQCCRVGASQPGASTRRQLCAASARGAVRSRARRPRAPMRFGTYTYTLPWRVKKPPAAAFEAVFLATGRGDAAGAGDAPALPRGLAGDSARPRGAITAERAADGWGRVQVTSDRASLDARAPPRSVHGERAAATSLSSVFSADEHRLVALRALRCNAAHARCCHRAWRLRRPRRRLRVRCRGESH